MLLTVAIRGFDGGLLLDTEAEIRSDHLLVPIKHPVELEQRSETDVQVSFIDDHLPSTYELVARARGYQQESITVGAIRAMETGATLVLRSPTYSSIGGRVESTTSAPISEVTIVAICADQTDPIDRAVSDYQGNFLLKGIPPGRELTLVTSSPGIERMAFAQPRLMPGEYRADVVLAIPALRTVTVRVRDGTTGRPVVGAFAENRLANRPIVSRLDAPALQSDAQSDALGQVRLRVPVGVAPIRVGAIGYRDASVNILADEAEKVVTLHAWTVIPVELTNGEDQPLGCPRVMPLVMTGRLLMSWIPSPDQLVDFLVSAPGSATPGDDARVVMSSLDDFPTSWNVYADRPAPLTLFLVSGDEILGRQTVASTDRVRVSVEQRRFCARGSLRLQVVQSGAAPLTRRLTIELQRRPGRYRYQENQLALVPRKTLLQASTDERGILAISNIFPGTYDLIVRTGDRPTDGAVIYDDSIMIQANEVNDLGEWSIGDLCSLDVAPLTEDGQRTLCRVSLYSHEREAYVVADPERQRRDLVGFTGQPTTIRNLRGGAYRVDIRTASYITSSEEVWLAKGDSSVCAPILTRGISVWVAPPPKVATARAYLRAEDSFGAYIDQLDGDDLDDLGRWYITVPPGRLRLRMLANDNEPEVAHADVIAKQDLLVELKAID